MTSTAPCPFRAVGFTADAANYPLSANGLALIAEFNGVAVDALPLGARHSSSAGMHAWIESLGARKASGQPYRDSGRLLLPSAA